MFVLSQPSNPNLIRLIGIYRKIKFIKKKKISANNCDLNLRTSRKNMFKLIIKLIIMSWFDRIVYHLLVERARKQTFFLRWPRLPAVIFFFKLVQSVQR